jgi:hypothetical protein
MVNEYLHCNTDTKQKAICEKEIIHVFESKQLISPLSQT